MKLQIVMGTLVLICLMSCTHSTDPDFSNIADPHIRWQDYKFSNYSIDQKLLCFCGNGGVLMKVVIRNNQIVNVIDISKGIPLPQNQWQWYKTVDQLFLMISNINKDSVASFSVDYDLKYGYPTSFFVDPSA